MNQAEWREVESKLWTDGVISGARNEFATTTTTGLGISVNTGDAVLDGFRFYADAATALTAATADPSLPRIDLLVLRIDESGHTSTIALKTGTPASSPAAPTVTQTAGGTYELALYQVRVNAGATSITSLTDVRTNAQPTLKGNAIGNASGDIPLSNGTLNTNLNADKLDGSDGSAFALLTGATFTGAVTATAFHGAADSAAAALALQEDGGKLLTAHVSGSSPSQFFLLVTPQPASDAVALGARVWDGSASHDITIVNSDGTINGAVQVSYFSGTGSGTFSHGLGTTPSWVGITCSQASSSMTVGVASYGSSTVVVTAGASFTWKGIAIK